MHAAFPCQRGMLVSTEGITGVGKTYLTARLRAESQPSAAGAVIIEEFSRRPARGELGHDLLHALISAAGGDPFLRSGHPASETLLLLAIKTYDYEAYCAPALYRGQLVLEGRSMHCVAVYQSLILHPEDDQQAHNEMWAILDIAARWRPLPDLTFLITDDVNTAVERAERRDGIIFTPEHRCFHHRAAALFDLKGMRGRADRLRDAGNGHVLVVQMHVRLAEMIVRRHPLFRDPPRRHDPLVWESRRQRRGRHL